MDSDGRRPMDSGSSTAWPVRLPAPPAAGPVRTGAAPPLAAGFAPRPETTPGLAVALVPGASAALVPAPGAAQPVPGTAGSCGKTQLAVSYARELWQAGEVDLLVWVTATSRASVLSGYIEAAAAMGIGPADQRDCAEQVAASFVGWLGQT